MNHLFSIALSLLILFSSTSCIGKAAAPEEDGGAEANPISAPDKSQPDTAEAGGPEETPPAAPDEPYVRTVDPSGPMVALTFDDGPHEIYTDQILDVLEENHAVATFFEVGRNVAGFPAPLARMAELGCEIASHSNAHRDLSKMKKSALLADLDTADEAFIAAAGAAPTLVRPPYGAVNQTVKYATGRTLITWTIDPQDWLSQDAQAVVSYIQGLQDLDGEIILLHSTYESTAQAVAVLVPWLQEQGYQLVTVTELMAYYYGEALQPGQFYGYTYFSTHGRTDTPIQLPAASEDEPDAGGDSEPEEAPEEGPSGEWTPTPVPAPEWTPTPEEPDTTPPGWLTA